MVKKEELTDRQSTVLRFIERSLTATGYPPTLREIGTQLGISSTNGVNDHLKALMRKGYLAKESGKSRTLKLLQPKSPPKVDKTSIEAIPIFRSLSQAQSSGNQGFIFAVFNRKDEQMTIYKRDLGVQSILTTFHIAK